MGTLIFRGIASNKEYRSWDSAFEKDTIVQLCGLTFKNMEEGFATDPSIPYLFINT